MVKAGRVVVQMCGPVDGRIEGAGQGRCEDRDEQGRRKSVYPIMQPELYRRKSKTVSIAVCKLTAAYAHPVGKARGKDAWPRTWRRSAELLVFDGVFAPSKG